MAENGQLHLEVIRYKEELQAATQDLKMHNKKLETERTDLIFLTEQKDRKIADLERTVTEMRQKLGEALQSTQYKKSTEIQKVFSKTKDVEDLSAKFQISNTLEQNTTQAEMNNTEHFKRQQEIWAVELRRADERADRFKDEADTLAQAKHQL